MYKNYLKRKEKVIISAIDILDEAGIQGLTTKEIAKREGVSEPAIYKQFDSKQDIILEIIERFAAFDQGIVNTISEQNIKPKAAILYFSEAHAAYYQGYPQITTVLFSMDVFRYEDKANTKMIQVIKNRHEFMTKIVEKAKESSEIITDLSAEDLADIILGVIWSTVFKWKLDGCKTELRDSIIKRINWLIES